MGDKVETIKQSSNMDETTHELSDAWTLWAHLPHDIDWSLNSYRKILTFKSLESAISITETLPHKMISKCMLFLMRDGIQPLWEDERNKKGGSFSYKVSNKDAPVTWRNLTYRLVGETLSNVQSVAKEINGITISHKKNFCIVKVWMATCNKQDPTIIQQTGSCITSNGCLFKKHNPEY